jgi:hypothetical protein
MLNISSSLRAGHYQVIEFAPPLDDAQRQVVEASLQRHPDHGGQLARVATTTDVETDEITFDTGEHSLSAISLAVNGVLADLVRAGYPTQFRGFRPAIGVPPQPPKQPKV